MQDKFCIFTKFLYDAKGGRKKTDRKDIMHALIHPSTHTFALIQFRVGGGGAGA